MTKQQGPAGSVAQNDQRDSGSTLELLQLCGGYFFFYVLTGLSVKYYLGSTAQGFPGMGGFEFLFYSTLGGQFICLMVVLWNRWYHLDSIRRISVRIGKKEWNIPSEWLYIVPSGICTSIVIPTTTLMYSLPISVMVAMIIMRGAVILISRVVDAIQIHQGIFKRRVYAEENWAVIFALAAVSVPLIWTDKGGFDFVNSPLAVGILGSYIFAYAFRIYIMNYFKNTTPAGVKRDNRQFFGVEQVSAGVSLALITAGVCLYPWNPPQVVELRKAITDFHPQAMGAIFAGFAYGMVAFFSVFIFMFKGRSATFAGLVNRLTSLLAGTFVTILIALMWGGKWPTVTDWISFMLIMVAVMLLSKAEKRRNMDVLSQTPRTDHQVSSLNLATSKKNL